MLPSSFPSTIEENEAQQLISCARKSSGGSVLSAPPHLIFNYGIFSEPTTNRIAALFSWLIPSARAWHTIASVGLFVVALQFVTYWITAYSQPSTTALLLVPLLMLWHELGHAAAMIRLGMRADGIGIGIYLLFPSLYTRLSLLRLASIDEQVLVYLAGAYFQGVAQIGILSAIYFLDAEWLVTLAAVNQLLIVLNLAPVLKFDGWVVTQLLISGIKKDRPRQHLQRAFELVTKVSLCLMLGWFLFRLGFAIYHSASTNNWSQHGTQTVLGLAVLLAVGSQFLSRKFR